MRRFLPQTIAAILVASALAWGQQFRMPDTKPRGHIPTFNPITVPISGAPQNGQKWPIQLPATELFPANFVGNSALDGVSGISCGTNITTPAGEVYTVKCGAAQIGQVTISGPAGANLVQQNIGSSAVTTVNVALTSNVTAGNTIVASWVIGSASFNPTFSLSAGTASIGSFSTCPVNGTPILNSSVAGLIGYARVTGSGSATITATVSSGTNTQVMSVKEYSGLLASPLDVCGAGATGTTSPVSTGASGAVQASGNELFVGLFGQACQGCTISSLTAGFTANTLSGAATDTVFPVDQAVSASAQNLTATATSTSSANWVGVMLALKATSGTACSPTFATTNGVAQLCLAGQRLEVDAPGTATGADISLTFAGHVP